MIASFAVISLSGCADASAKQQAEQQDRASHPQAAIQSPAASSDISTRAATNRRPAPVENPRATTIGMSARLDVMEAKLSAMNDKLDATRASIDNFLAAHQPKATGVPKTASDIVGIPWRRLPSRRTPNRLRHDQAIQPYRKGEILLESQKYADAILVFSNFLEHFPDHALAGSAQFHIGEARFKQKQWRAASRSFRRS